MGPWLLLLQATALLGCGALAGLFFGFSTAVMPALAQVPPAQAAAVLFLAAVFGVTVVINVPLNHRLAAGADWAAFAPRWVRWNLVRGVASALAALLMVPALVHGG